MRPFAPHCNVTTSGPAAEIPKFGIDKLPLIKRNVLAIPILRTVFDDNDLLEPLDEKTKSNKRRYSGVEKSAKPGTTRRIWAVVQVARIQDESEKKISWSRSETVPEEAIRANRELGSNRKTHHYASGEENCRKTLMKTDTCRANMAFTENQRRSHSRVTSHARSVTTYCSRVVPPMADEATLPKYLSPSIEWIAETTTWALMRWEERQQQVRENRINKGLAELVAELYTTKTMLDFEQRLYYTLGHYFQAEVRIITIDGDEFIIRREGGIKSGKQVGKGRTGHMAAEVERVPISRGIVSNVVRNQKIVCLDHMYLSPLVDHVADGLSRYSMNSAVMYGPLMAQPSTGDKDDIYAVIQLIRPNPDSPRFNKANRSFFKSCLVVIGAAGVHLARFQR